MKSSQVIFSPPNSASRLGQVSLVVQVCVGQGCDGVAQVLGDGHAPGAVRLEQEGHRHRRGGRRRGRGGGRQVRGQRQPRRQVSQHYMVTIQTKKPPVDLHASMLLAAAALIQ